MRVFVVIAYAPLRNGCCYGCIYCAGRLTRALTKPCRCVVGVTAPEPAARVKKLQVDETGRRLHLHLVKKKDG